jgi:HEAT repeat protein
LPGEMRSQIRTLVDGAVKKGGAAVAGLVLGALAYFGGESVGTGTVIALSGVTLALIPRMRKLYVRALEDKLGRRQRRGEGFAIDLSDNATAQVLLGALDSGDPDRVIAALDALGEGYALAREHLVRLLGHNDERVRVAALRHVPHQIDPMLTSWLLGILHDERARRPRSEAIRALQWTAATDAARHVEQYLRDADPGAVTAAIEVGLLQRVEGPFRTRLDELVAGLHEATPAVRREVARLLGRLGEARYDTALVALIQDPEPTVRALAIEAAGRERHVALLDELIAALGDRALRASTQDALKSFGDLAVGALSRALDDKDLTLAVRIHIPRVLASIDTEDAARALMYSNPRDDAYLQRRISDRLMEIMQRHREFRVGRERADEAIRRRLRSYAAYQKAEQELATLPDRTVKALGRFVAERRDLNLRIALQLLGIHHGIDRMMSVFRGLSAPRTEGDNRRQAALELLDVALAGDGMRDELLELLDRPPVTATADAGRDRVLLLARSKDPLLRAVARRATGELYGPSAPELQSDGPSFRAIVPGAEELEGDDMREELVERLLFLENVDLFEGLHADDLAAIAGLCTEEDFTPGARIYSEGAPGDCLYVVVEGEVDITKKGEHIITLSPGESLGQVSFLDQGARPVSADVSSRSRARLLRIERGAFLDLLSDRPGLMHAFFAVLARRLRLLIDRGASETSM